MLPVGVGLPWSFRRLLDLLDLGFKTVLCGIGLKEKLTDIGIQNTIS
jgi:hypothetical protein